MTNIIKGKPTYLDKVPVINKVTIAPGEEREVTLLLEPHTGEAGRNKDAKIIAYMVSQSDEMTEAELVMKFASDPEMLDIAQIVLDLDDEEGRELMDKLTLWDIVYAFREAVPYRTQQVQNPKVQEALKKLKGDENSVETA